MSVTPRRSWPTNDAHGDSQRPSTGNIHHQAHHPHRPANMTGHTNNSTAANLPSLMADGSAQKAGQAQTLKPPLAPVMTPQVRPVVPPGSSSLFSPPSGTQLPSMGDMQQPLFVNGQSDMNAGYAGLPPHNNMVHVKSENVNQTAGGQYDFQSRMDLPMNDFEQHQKDMMQMPSDNLFNSLAQPPIHHSQSLNDIKSSNVSSPAMSMPVSGGKPKSHSAAMAQVRNASSWSSLAGSSGGPPGSSKSSNIGDSFQMFKRQAKEKEARQKALIEQQEMRRQQKEQAERERMRAEADRRREREEEEALENARFVYN